MYVYVIKTCALYVLCTPIGKEMPNWLVYAHVCAICMYLRKESMCCMCACMYHVPQFCKEEANSCKYMHSYCCCMCLCVWVDTMFSCVCLWGFIHEDPSTSRCEHIVKRHPSVSVCMKTRHTHSHTCCVIVLAISEGKGLSQSKCLCMCICLYIHIYTHIHTHIHVHICRGLPSRPRWDTAVSIRLYKSPSWNPALVEDFFVQ